MLVIELTPISDINEAERVIPKVVGLHLREALNELAANGIEAIVNGSGKVISQQPKSGTRIRNGEQCLLECESSVDLVRLLNL